MIDYEPRIIILPDLYDEYELLLHRELASFAINLDPPNPFRTLTKEGEGVKIVVNDTNDLPFAIQHFQLQIKDGKYHTVIVGDPAPNGYSLSVLDRLVDESEYRVKYIRNKDWIIFMINIDEGGQLYIEDGKFVFRQNVANLE